MKKKSISVILSGVMALTLSTGDLGFVPGIASDNCGIVHAGVINSFTLSVPASAYITSSGWNDWGSVGVSDVSIDDDKKISVTIEGGATGRTLKKTDDSSKTIAYEIMKGTSASNEEYGTVEFKENGTQIIGAFVDKTQFVEAEAGKYEDTINFTATIVDDYIS